RHAAAPLRVRQPDGAAAEAGAVRAPDAPVAVPAGPREPVREPALTLTPNRRAAAVGPWSRAKWSTISRCLTRHRYCIRTFTSLSRIIGLPLLGSSAAHQSRGGRSPVDTSALAPVALAPVAHARTATGASGARTAPASAAA